jgi:hypothetical protein
MFVMPPSGPIPYLDFMKSETEMPKVKGEIKVTPSLCLVNPHAMWRMEE